MCSPEFAHAISVIRKEMELTMTKRKHSVLFDDYDYLGNSASVTDCTGLIPSAPQNHDELESYEDLYHYRPPQIKSMHAPEAQL